MAAEDSDESARPGTADERRRLLGEFLRSRRARIDPTTVGLPTGDGRRRVPGLRREEVALLANVGLTWYTWLEQGREIQPSAEVLDAIAGALRLDGHERRHLLTLARPDGRDTEGSVDVADLGSLVHAITSVPAYAVSARWDVLAHNEPSTRLLGPLGPTPDGPANLMHLAFTRPSWRSLLIDWEHEAVRHVAMYRASMVWHLGDPAWTSLADELVATSDDFRRIWEAHDVTGPEARFKRFHHPLVGRLVLRSTALVVADDPEVRVMVLRPEADVDRERLDRLNRGAPTPRDGETEAGGPCSGHEPPQRVRS